MKRAMYRIMLVALVGSLSLLVACSKSDGGGDTEGKMEQAGKEAGETADKAATEADKAAKDAVKAIEGVGK